MTVDRDNLLTIMEREIDAPRDLVWRAHTEPELMSQWWGPRRYNIEIVTYEPHVGGKWRMKHTAEGEEHVFFGEFREIEKPDLPEQAGKITWTFNYEPYPNTEIVETIYFEELPDGKTKLRSVSIYPTIEALDGMVQSGMEEGANESWDRLNELVRAMK